MGKFGIKNKVQIDPLKYNIGLIGESGIGKTTIIKDVCEKLAGEDGYIFLECGKEDGADAIEGIVYENVPDYDTLDDIITDVVDNKETDYPNLKVMVIDTIDQAFAITEPEVIRLHNKENPEKRTSSIKAAFGGFMGGEDKCIELVLNQLWRLKLVGVHFIIIGHTKVRDIVDPVTGATYTTLTTNMPNRYFNAIKTKLHFLGVGSIERDIEKRKISDKKNPVTKKEDYRNIVTEENRKITFRDDNYTIDSKSRFADIVGSIPFEADEFIKALTDAIKVEQSKNKDNKSFEEVKKIQEKADKKFKEEVAKLEVEKKSNEKISEMNSYVMDFMKKNRSVDTQKSNLQKIMKQCRDNGFDNPLAVDNLEISKDVYDFVKSIEE